MLLQDLLYKTKVEAINGATDLWLSGLQLNSAKVQKDNVFFASKGATTDGHQYIQNAVENGAAVIVCQEFPVAFKEGVTYIKVEDSAKAMAEMSTLYFGEPSLSLQLVGVTGTNGKTTVATLLYKLFTDMGHKCGLMSTVQNKIGKEVLDATHTTPNTIELNRLLRQMKDAGCAYVFMECSSHAIQQERIYGLHFTGAIFTNITHDHLDYHKTFDEYIRVKKHWFDHLPKDAFAISNADDKRGAVMLQNTKAKKYYYSLRTLADFKGKIMDNSLEGLFMKVNDTDVNFRLIGEFNAYNLLAVYGAAICLGIDKETVLLHLSKLDGAEGRFEYIKSKNDGIVGIVDYAHTPDALLNVLHTIKNLKEGNSQLITVVGCGGNRDKTKRPLMAEVACEHSTKAILTSDNPRLEDPAEILKDMEAGVDVTKRKKTITIADRREAIKTAISLAGKNDVVLIAGKGHEKYQEINGVKHPFDDKEVLKEMFELLDK